MQADEDEDESSGVSSCSSSSSIPSTATKWTRQLERRRVCHRWSRDDIVALPAYFVLTPQPSDPRTGRRRAPGEADKSVPASCAVDNQLINYRCLMTAAVSRRASMFSRLRVNLTQAFIHPRSRPCTVPSSP